jgi:hypothetical protein
MPSDSRPRLAECPLMARCGLSAAVARSTRPAIKAANGLAGGLAALTTPPVRTTTTGRKGGEGFSYIF